MAQKKTLIAALHDSADSESQVIVHIKGERTEYDTACGLDLTAEGFGHIKTDLPKIPKINCKDCRYIWATVKGYTERDFAKEFN
jgi:hypothetical protein